MFYDLQCYRKTLNIGGHVSEHDMLKSIKMRDCVSLKWETGCPSNHLSPEKQTYLSPKKAASWSLNTGSLFVPQ